MSGPPVRVHSTPTALYVCYFNTEEPLVHTQVLPYVQAVAASGVSMHLLTYEAASRWDRRERQRRQVLKAQLAARGIVWHALGYHKHPSLFATAYDVIAGIILSVWVLLRSGGGPRIVHARSHVAGAIGLALKRLIGARLIFDFRGLLAEEYVDNGTWGAGSLPFRIVKAAERHLLEKADHVIVLTARLKSQLTDGTRASVEAEKISVIPCCVDLSRYPKGRVEAPARSLDDLTVIYVGSTEGRYQLAEMADFFRLLSVKTGRARFRIVTRSSREIVEPVLESRGVDLRDCSIVSARPDEVPALLRDGDVGLFFIQRSAALDGASPTKIGEYLAAGIPVVSSSQVGDTDSILREERVGVIVPRFTDEDYEIAASQLFTLLEDPGTPARCREVAERHYSLRDVGELRYRAVYQRLAALH